ncbi:TPA: VWA domain-containing protein [Candidatus Woesearchaeota archaeon]|nr:VWA domain-containing protein [Candidatus Woesearchaeota archaeon]
MVDVTFEKIHFLWVLFTIPLMIALHFFLMKYTRHRALIFANFEALRRVTGGMVLSKNISLLVTRVIIVILFTLAAAGLTIWIKAPSSTFNYVIAVDSSASMLAKDYDPDRITIAKLTAQGFVDTVVADVEVGVVSFSGVPRVESEMTSNKEQIKEAIESIEVRATGGTDIASAIISSVNLLAAKQDRARSVIILTDGRHTTGGPLSEAMKYAREKEVAVMTIGIATAEGGSFEATELLSTLDEEALQSIATSTGGKFMKATNVEEMKGAFSTIIEQNEQNLPHPMRVWLLGIGMLFLFIEWGLINTRFRMLP